MATIHHFSEAVMLSAATTRLVKTARRWFDLSPAGITLSWQNFKTAIIERFQCDISYLEMMHKIEAKKWNYSKESFQDYAMEKLLLIQKIKLPEQESIRLLIDGIPHLSIKAAAMAMRIKEIDLFLREMKNLTSACSNSLKKFSPTTKPEKINPESKKKDVVHSPTSTRKPPSPQTSLDLFCAYCKSRDHTKDSCQKLKKKEQARETAQTSPTNTVAAVEASSEDSSSTVAYVKTIIASDSVIKVSAINNITCNALALIDTGSPVSFLGQSAFEKYFESSSVLLKKSDQIFRGLGNYYIPTIGSFVSQISLEVFPDSTLNVTLHVLKGKEFSADFIFGRDFLSEHDIWVKIKSEKDKTAATIELFKEIATVEVIDTSNDFQNCLTNLEIDFDISTKYKLTSTLSDIESSTIESIDDNFNVEIKLKDDTVYAYAPRRFAWSERVKLREITDDLLKRGIIKPSTSPYCARVVPVRKKDGSMRLCVDLRPLNKRTIKQKCPFPAIEDCISRLGGHSVFTLLDLKDGFHNIKLHPDVTKYFAFATPDGQFEYTRLPFGFCESPAEFQKRLVHILQPFIRNDTAIVYIDDILLPSHTISDNLQSIRLILTELKKHNLQVNYNKCLFLRRRLEYLGYMLSPDGITLSERHIEAVRNFPRPRTMVELQRFLGLTGYFRKFVKSYALIARPLQNLLRKSVPFIFDRDCEIAFEALKQALISYPVLRIYDPTLPTEIHTDASAVAIAGILLQKQKSGQWAPIAFFSQATNNAESKYHSFELEMLAILRTIERFHIYLYGLNFTVITDCYALVHAINKANINPRIARWILKLQNYTFHITHREGGKMVHVDALSRVIAYTEVLPLEKELQYRQLQDLHIQKIAQELEQSEHDKFTLCDGLVYRKGSDKSRFLVPETMIFHIIRIYHDDMAHCGVEKTIQGIASNYWFPSMRRKVQNYVDNCVTCLVANAAINAREGEMQITDLPSVPFEIMHIDHFGPFKEASEGFKHILIIVDAFTRFSWLFPVKSTTSREVIKHLTTLFNNTSNPVTLASDRGTAFTSQEFLNFIRTRKINHRLVAVAAPWANGLVERINRFIKSSLRKLVDIPETWSTYVPTIQYVINNTFHSSLKSTPAKLLFGTDKKEHCDSTLVNFLNDLAKVELNFEQNRNVVRDIALKATRQIKEYNKEYYDERHRKPSQYKQGDYVLIRDSVIKYHEDKKLKPLYKGPYLVAKVLNKNRYVIQDIPGFNITAKPYNSILSTDRMKPWIKPVT